MPLFTTPPAPWTITNPEVVMQGSSFVLVANTVYLYAFELLAPVSVASLRYRAGSTATGTVDLGIYDANGNLLGHTGATNTIASGLQSIALTSLSLSPGRYLMALCPSNSTDTYVGQSGLKLGGGRYFAATNTGTAGVLPAATGTIVTSAIALEVVAVVTGGTP